MPSSSAEPVPTSSEEPKTAHPVFCLKATEPGGFHSLCFQTPGLLLSGNANGKVQRWDLGTNRSTWQLAVGKSPIIGLAHPKNALITQEKAGPLKRWELTNSEYVLRHEISTGHVGFCRFVLQNDTVIIPRGESNIVVLGVEDFAERQLLNPDVKEWKLPPVGTVMCLVPTEVNDKPYLLAGYEAGYIVLWDLTSFRPISHLNINETTKKSADQLCLMVMDYTTDEGRGYCGGSLSKIFAFYLNRQAMELVMGSEHPVKTHGVTQIKIRKDRKVFVTAGRNGRIRVTSWKSLNDLAVLTEHTREVLDVVYSKEPVPRWKAIIMAVAGADGKISLWDLYNQRI